MEFIQNFTQNVSDFIRDKPWIAAIILLIILGAIYMVYNNSTTMTNDVEAFSSNQSATGSRTRKSADDKYATTRQ